MARIAPSILSADFAALADSISGVAPETDLLHVDVMDGHFVPNLTIGPPVVKSIRRHCASTYLDCHLMMTNPREYLEAFAKAGANGCTVHVELDDDDVAASISTMRDLGLDVGLAVNPETPYDACRPFLDRIDLLLIMSVHPGFGGQSFMPEVVPKVVQAKAEIAERGLDVAIQVDGGIDVHTVGTMAQAGATAFVAGSAIFGADDPRDAARRLREAARAG